LAGLKRRHPPLKKPCSLSRILQIGVMDCVADDAQSCADIANRLANDKVFRNEIRNRILKNAGVLYEDMEAVHELESFFERVVKEKMQN